MKQTFDIKNFEVLGLRCPSCYRHLSIKSFDCRGINSVLHCPNIICELADVEYEWPSITLNVVETFE